MSSFFDRDGREWRCEFTMQTVKEMQSELGIELGELLKHRFTKLIELMDDPRKYIDWLYLVLRPQIEASEMDEIAFCRSINGDAYEESQKSMVLGLADFCPSHQRQLMKQLVAKWEIVGNLMLERQTEILDQIRPEELVDRFGNTESNSQPSGDVSDN